MARWTVTFRLWQADRSPLEAEDVKELSRRLSRVSGRLVQETPDFRPRALKGSSAASGRLPGMKKLLLVLLLLGMVAGAFALVSRRSSAA